ncbi:MAG: TonB-dependent siderophore receptor [Pseudomonas sp.]|uniref:TonB-dependent siderophore receptor n=1 Tax=Pseudomonas sp. TaxID=306 RepID=UPI003D12F7DF
MTSTSSPRPLPNLRTRALLSLLLAAPASALAAPVHDYELTQGGLGEALTGFAAQSGVVLSFDTRLTAGLRSPGLRGHHSVDEALALLLSGTGLQAVRETDGRYSLVKLPEDSAMVLATSTINAQGLSDITEGSTSYTTGSVSIGKTPQAIKDTPQTVSVISRQRLDDQKLTTVAQAMTQTTGISLFEGSLTSTRYLSRGFEITNFRVDGGASMADGVWKNSDTAIFDHIEVLRGADGLFAGSGEPGGTVNFVRKRPTFVPQASLTTSAGSWDDYRSELDVSGPLAVDGKLRGRAVLVSQNKQSFMDDASANHDLFYGVLEADLTETTNLLVGLTHSRYRDSDQAYGLPRYSTGEDLKLPRSTFLAGANDYYLQRDNSYFATLKQQLGEDWSLNLDTLYTRSRTLRDYYNFNGAIDPATGGGSGAEWGYQNAKAHERSVDISLRGDFTGFGLDHSLVAGWMWHDFETRTPLLTGGFVSVPNIFNFDPKDYPSLKAQAVKNGSNQTSRRSDGFYTNLRLQLAEPLHWFVGASLTNYRYAYDYNDAITGVTSPSRYDDRNVLVPYTGLTYALTPQWTAYGSVSEIYKSQADRLAGPLPGSSSLDPISGRNYELGVKGSLWDGRVNTYVALYYVKREGEAVRDPNSGSSSNSQTGASCCFLRDGEVTSKGIDVEVSGEVLERLQATFGYTYNHIEKNASSLDYTSLTPKHLAKLFATYQLPGAWSAFKLGGGATAQSASFVSGSAMVRDSNGNLTQQSQTYSFGQAGYTLWNAFAHYDVDEHWSLALNAENLLDKRYYSTVGYSDYANFYGEPRRYVLTLSGRF